MSGANPPAPARTTFGLPTDPETRLAAVLVIAAVLIVLGIGVVFRDVNPS